MAVTGRRRRNGVVEFTGSNLDAKPVVNTPVGSTFHDVDTGATHTYTGVGWRPEGTGYEGGSLFVDKVYGNDTRGASGGHPFLTVAAALAVATGGTIVRVGAGVFDEPPLVMPQGVSIRGSSTGSTTIRRTGVTTPTTLLTVGENCRVEDLTLLLSSTQHVTLVGMAWPGTTPRTSKLRTAVLTVDNASASPTGTSDVYGHLVTGTIIVPVQILAIRAVTTTVSSAGAGTKRGLLITGPAEFNSEGTRYGATSTAGQPTIGVETNHAGAVFRGRLDSYYGSFAAIRATLGNILVNESLLDPKNCGGLGFDPNLARACVPLLFGIPAGGAAAGTRYLFPGTATPSTVVIRMPVPYAVVYRGMSIKVSQGPGGTRTDTFTLMRGVADGAPTNTSLTVSLVGSAASSSNYTVSVAYSPGDTFAIKYVKATGSQTQNVILALDGY